MLKVSVSEFDKHNRFGGVSDSRLVSGDNTDARMKGAAKVSVSEFDKLNRFGGVYDSRLVSCDKTDAHMKGASLQRSVTSRYMQRPESSGLFQTQPAATRPKEFRDNTTRLNPQANEASNC